MVDDSTGELAVSYAYDAWGVLYSVTGSAADTVGKLNSLRYRGYCYDEDTEMYYLQSRYYDPEMRRFINADEPEIIEETSKNSVLGSNMFAYCENNPVNHSDPSGQCYRTGNGGVGHDNWEFPEKYDRNKAVSYAQKWYNGYNESYYQYSQDCANFVSQCLRAGGIFMSKAWHSFRLSQKAFSFKGLFKKCLKYNWDVSDAWRLADAQYNYFKKNYLKGDIIKILSKNDIKKTISNYDIKKGDLMYFVNTKNKKDNIHHATIIVKVDQNDIYYAAHTTSQKNKRLSQGIGNEKVYIIRIKK